MIDRAGAISSGNIQKMDNSAANLDPAMHEAAESMARSDAGEAGDPLEFDACGAEVLSLDQVRQRVGRLGAGDSFCWYRGYLPTDRREAGPEPRPAGDWRQERGEAVDRLARFMLKHRTESLRPGLRRRSATATGHLWQRRVGHMFYEYWFTRGAEPG